jgi:hypothetical protein
VQADNACIGVTALNMRDIRHHCTRSEVQCYHAYLRILPAVSISHADASTTALSTCGNGIGIDVEHDCSVRRDTQGFGFAFDLKEM